MITFDFDETDSSSNSTSSDFSPPELQRDFPPSPGQVAGGYAIGSNSPPSKGSISPYDSPDPYTISMPSSMPVYPVDSPDHLPIQNARHSLSALPDQAYTYSSLKPNTSYAVSGSVSDICTYSYPHSPSRVTSICLWTDGMAPLSIKLDALMSPHTSICMPLVLELRLSIAPNGGVTGTSPQDGFFTSVSLSKLWNNFGKCVTRVYANNICTSEVVGALDVSNIEMGIVNATLPESSLSRCRWLDACKLM